MTGRNQRSRRSSQRNLLYEEPSWWGLVALGVIVFALVVALTILFFRGGDPVASPPGERLSHAQPWPVLDEAHRVSVNPRMHA
jgi:fumarate reductase subunit D